MCNCSRRDAKREERGRKANKRENCKSLEESVNADVKISDERAKLVTEFL